MTEDNPLERRRKSLTKLQRTTAVGVELVALCQTITEDARLVDGEIASLRQWLHENRASDLPAVVFLTETVERILADGKVTPEERLELYLAIETILPPDVRSSVRGTRLSGEKFIKDIERTEREAAKQLQPRSARPGVGTGGQRAERDTPVSSWDFMVAGVGFERRHEIVKQFAAPHNIVYLVRDRKNIHRRHATELRLTQRECRSATFQRFTQWRSRLSWIAAIGTMPTSRRSLQGDATLTEGPKKRNTPG